MHTLGQIHNVLIILAITLIMAVVTTAIAYIVDLIPSAVDSGAQIATNASVAVQQATEWRSLALKSGTTFSASDE